jgi:hypothetical protein
MSAIVVDPVEYSAGATVLDSTALLLLGPGGAIL